MVFGILECLDRREFNHRQLTPRSSALRTWLNSTKLVIMSLGGSFGGMDETQEERLVSGEQSDADSVMICCWKRSPAALELYMYEEPKEINYT